MYRNKCGAMGIFWLSAVVEYSRKTLRLVRGPAGNFESKEGGAQLQNLVCSLKLCKKGGLYFVHALTESYVPHALLIIKF